MVDPYIFFPVFVPSTRYPSGVKHLNILFESRGVRKTQKRRSSAAGKGCVQGWSWKGERESERERDRDRESYLKIHFAAGVSPMPGPL